MNVWFVSQGIGFDVEDQYSYLRAPSDDGIPHHIRINYLAQGDAVILYHEQAVYGIGFYESFRYEPFPDGVQSRIVYLDRIKFRNPIPKFRIFPQMKDAQKVEEFPTQKVKGFPIDKNLNVNEGYCYHANEEMLNIVLEHCNDEAAKSTIKEKIEYSQANFKSVSYVHLTLARPAPITNANGGNHQHRPTGAIPPASERNPFEETTFTDERDGHVYRAIQIGGKTWLAENFRYQNTDNRIKGVYIVMTKENTEKYGYLYTWGAAQAACPAGWHLPTDEEWNKLFKDTYNVETLINHYKFECPKAGILNPEKLKKLGIKAFCSFNENTVFWSASENPHKASEASRWTMSDKTKEFTNLYMGKNFAFSVRYVKDTENE